MYVLYFLLLTRFQRSYCSYPNIKNMCDAVGDLVSFAQFKKTCNTFKLQPATLLKVALLHGCFSRFLNCSNCTKSRKVSCTGKLNIQSYFI